VEIGATAQHGFLGELLYHRAGPDIDDLVDDRGCGAIENHLTRSGNIDRIGLGARVIDSAAVRISLSSASTSNQVIIDRDAASIVYQVVDDRTSQVVKQFPEEAVLRRRAYFHTLDLTKDAPTRLRATDRSA